MTTRVNARPMNARPMNARRLRRTALSALTAASALALSVVWAGAARAQSAYTLAVCPLAGAVSRGVNDSAHVVGYATPSSGPRVAFYWTGAPGAPVTLLPSLPGVTPAGTIAFSVNAADQVVGYASFSTPGGTDQHAFLWRPGDAALTDLDAVEDVLTAQGWEIYQANRVTDAGQILADGQRVTGYDSTGAPVYQAAALLLTPSATAPGHYDGAVISAPSASSAMGLDLSSNGYALLGNPTVFYSGSALVPVNGANGVNGVNASGEIVGTVQGQQNVHLYAHAAYWSGPSASPKDLGVFGGYDSVARSINDAHTVVGNSSMKSGPNHAFRWKPGQAGLTDLNSFLPKGTSYTLTDAWHISPAGVITGQGANSTAYVLVPSAP